MTQPVRRGRPPKAKVEQAPPPGEPGRPCDECYPEGWPAREHGAHVGCPHGSWTYRE